MAEYAEAEYVEYAATLGQLISLYRQLAGITAQTVADTLPGPFNSSSAFSRLESDRTAKPTVDLLTELAIQLGLTHRQFTQLLAAADYPPIPEELAAARSALSPRIQAWPYPAYVLDYRSFLRAWNDKFAQLVGTSQGGVLFGTSFLKLLFAPDSGLREHVLAEDWLILARAYVELFTRATRRLIQKRWGGDPEWLRILLAEIQTASQYQTGSSADRPFIDLYQEAQQPTALQAPSPLTHASQWDLPEVLIACDGKPTSVTFTQLRVDARLWLVKHEPYGRN